MITIEPITIDHKEEYDSNVKNITISYYRFANIFMSRDCTGFKFLRTEGGALIAAILREGMMPMVHFPVGAKDLGAAIAELKEKFGNFMFAPLNKQMVAQLSQILGDRMVVKRTRNHDDYIYKTQDLIELSGKKYHSKRNFIRRFMLENQYEYVALTEQDMADTKPLLDIWFAEHPGYESDYFNERQAIRELMEHFSRLNLKGAAIKVAGKVVALTIGERMAPDTAHILIEKADTSYQGAYPVINQSFLVNEWADTEFVNREEDMGLDGLRRAKMSYYPAHMNEMYRVTLL